ncbi:MAG: hypothetical protein HDQ88_10455, partial [Clostridia bacterium]|nr:hypothetical protein [Clostridia bacterium]
MQELLKLIDGLNALIEKENRAERFVLETQDFEGKTQHFGVIKNETDFLSLAVSYWDGELLIEYLGSHSHEDGDEDCSVIFKRYVLPILKNRLVAVHYFTDEGKLGMIADEILPESIPFTFTDEEVPNP